MSVMSRYRRLGATQKSAMVGESPPMNLVSRPVMGSASRRFSSRGKSCSSSARVPASTRDMSGAPAVKPSSGTALSPMCFTRVLFVEREAEQVAQ
jgi:hypothetical protein